MKNLIYLAMFLFSINVMAQPAPPPSHNPAPIPGLIYLAAGGALIAYRKYQNKQEEEK